ncbi:MAG TPA: hypothetical protein ENO20_08455 [Bacteroides sp.]|nr:hypothetical protein [Bacteroides sp.]
MKKNFWILLVSVFILTSVDTTGQARWKLRRYELDLYLAATAFHGDIGLANQHFANNFNGVRPDMGIQAKYKITEKLLGTLDLGYLMYGGKDKEGSTHNRVYSFTTHAFQHTLRAEYYVLGEWRKLTSFAVYNRQGLLNNYSILYLYGFAGFGGVMTKAKVKDLNNGGAEPLDNPGYDNNLKYAAVFPVGIGIKFAIDPRWSLGAEIGYMFTTSDYLDGYSSQWSDYRDSYYLTSVKAIYHIRNNNQNRPIFRKYYR